MERIDCAVIGAGVIGLACARALASAGREVLILEAGDRFGGGSSSRNSEVIHAGLYYPTGSLKAALCVRGRELLYRYCAARNLPHRRCGKLVVATASAQEAGLDRIAQRAAANGVDDLVRLTGAAACRLEPALHCTAALHSPSTGIVDSHALMLALLGDAEAHGALLALRTPVLGGECGPEGLVLHTGGEAPLRIHANIVINAAGLTSPALAARFDGFPTAHLPQAHFAKGNYFSLQGRTPFSRLVYPVPEAAGLGVHLTLDLQGRARFGPDVEWLDLAGRDLPPDAQDFDYRVDPRRADAFHAEIRRYWPALPDDALAPDYAGIRPKISGPGEAAADFRIDGPQVHGVPGLVNLFGIESPGLTASLAIAERVAALLREA
ncbi:NAD(P)/FAD-dependent oxidoreductase [Pseudothauera rhizosphaerae]|uniref:NAD(P)/FAD-dependent oxidoreductase n=1 Tax=Pseudothauera rhizosphaerae TaxID=2565932 RepID=A0A4S4AB85_9RHOO|nr:NAD(P)/FAD-dependent oxidoreductase [Pseudothauera rhizosphaerae]THF55893.1 NAD(P)/FAD-dependent oxidoreductase [Pseudothauera rhizosphaerae]